MYVRYADRQGWKLEVLSVQPSDLGGIDEATFLVKGADAWQRLHNEGGAHRVQRVPVTESQGRVHTSSAAVTVLPEADEVEVELVPSDLRIDVYRSTGRAASRSTRRTQLFASRTCRPASSWRCKTKKVRFKTAPRRSWSCGRGS